MLKVDFDLDTTETDVTMTKDANDRYAVKANEPREPVRQSCDAAKLNEFGETIQTCKALCYEDICL